jgi:hypothetical protein
MPQKPPAGHLQHILHMYRLHINKSSDLAQNFAKRDIPSADTPYAFSGLFPAPGSSQKNCGSSLVQSSGVLNQRLRIRTLAASPLTETLDGVS